MKVALTSFGVAAIVSIVACSGGQGTASNLRGGPDGIPKSSTDAPGTGNESPGNSSQDAPGSSEDGTGNCITCSGSYACTSTITGSTSTSGSQTGTSFVTLGSVSGGCSATTADETDLPVLLCGGEFVDTQDGSSIAAGRWSGDNSGFTITASVNGVTIVVVCAPSNAPQPQPQPGTGGSDTLDAG